MDGWMDCKDGMDGVDGCLEEREKRKRMGIQ